jgi:hypothetical protein
MCSGDILGAIAVVQPKLKEIQDTNHFTKCQVYFLLLAQQFIELVRSGNFAAAFKWAQEEMIPFSTGKEECSSLQAEVLGLLAYQEPLTSPIRHLLDKTRYSWLADLLNQSLLKAPDSALEALFQQVMAVDAVVEEFGGFDEEADAKKWSSLQNLLTGTSLITKCAKNIPLQPILKLLKND